MFDRQPGLLVGALAIGLGGLATYALLDVFLSLRGAPPEMKPAAATAAPAFAAPASALPSAPIVENAGNAVRVAPAPPPRYVGVPQGGMPVYRCKQGEVTVFSDRPCGPVTDVLVVAAPRPDDPNFRPRSYREQLDAVRALGASGGERRGSVASLGAPPSEKSARCASIYSRIDALNEQARTTPQGAGGPLNSVDPGRAKRDVYDEAFKAGC
ncbi:MAG: hypothetical protein MUC55_05375 [Burkholderiales bacterium]|jgi:hypothetical protein|nr:hypothetical protein [Burkholderiales bacterium]